jgi:3-oxoacyl-(acyl-carrier-protein) synthase
MSGSSPRVVVTGLGVASPLGVGRKAFAEGLASGRCAIEELDGRLSLVAPGAGALVDVPRKEYRNYFDTRLLRLSTMTRQTTLGCIACGTLLEDADCPPDGESYPDRGAYLGSFIVPPDFAKQARSAAIMSHRPENEARGYVIDDARLDEAMKMASAFDFLRALPNMPSAHLSIQAGYQGPACTYLGSDSSGLQSMGMAVGAIRSGTAVAMIAGGAFCPFQEIHLAWQQTRGLWANSDNEPSGRILPYGLGRSGTLPGEAGALFLFEEREHALLRGAPILAEVTGFAQRFAAPGEGEDLAVRSDALSAACSEEAVDWVAPTGLGHPQLDLLEAQAFEQALGSRLDSAGMVNVVPQIGFSGPAAAPMQLAAALMVARGEAIAPALDVDADPGCATLAASGTRTGKTGAGSVVVGSSFSLDGVHAALTLRVEA